MIKNTIQLGIFCSVSKSQCVTHCVGFIISVQHLVVSEKHIYCFFYKTEKYFGIFARHVSSACGECFAVSGLY